MRKMGGESGRELGLEFQVPLADECLHWTISRTLTVVTCLISWAGREAGFGTGVTHTQPIWVFLGVCEYENKGNGLLAAWLLWGSHSLRHMSPLVFYTGGGAPPSLLTVYRLPLRASKWQSASHLLQANKPFNQSACQPQGKETPEELILRIRWLESRRKRKKWVKKGKERGLLNLEEEERTRKWDTIKVKKRQLDWFPLEIVWCADLMVT